MLEGVSLCDENGTILYTNPAEDKMFGYAPGELVGQHMSVQIAGSPEEHETIFCEITTRSPSAISARAAISLPGFMPGTNSGKSSTPRTESSFIPWFLWVLCGP